MKQVFYVPDRGDVVRISRPARVAGGENRQRATGPPRSREALVLSPQDYNERTGLALACPLVRRGTGYPFEVAMPPGGPVSGVVLADRPFSFDWRSFRAERICPLLPGAVEEALAKTRALLA
ncbi:MAG TPA: mRNA-degrading endonuclease [Candidatus Aminicenantes bacterium]|nr:type II toxin-antitoxin system PemK/MazF family toxin [Candidatus Aminicenantes bacterium]HDT14374.1 mRNA-degrading endonuclease [Candidatus Aminicenantes bacterium]